MTTPGGDTSAAPRLLFDQNLAPSLARRQHAEGYRGNAADAERAEYFVRVEWLDAVPRSRAVNEVGLFGNQNTVCHPATPRWRRTVERLKTHFPNWDGTPRSRPGH